MRRLFYRFIFTAVKLLVIVIVVILEFVVVIILLFFVIFRDFFGLSPDGSEEPPETGNKWRADERLECILQETLERRQ